MSQIRHAWLFEPGIWTATGLFWDRGESAYEGRGGSIIRHTEDAWAVEGTMEVRGEPPLRIENAYRMEVPTPDARIIPWQSENPALGALAGVFVIADDAIMSSFQSADGTAVGSEHLICLAPDRYQARGLFLASGNVVSAWSMALTRTA